MSAARRVCGCDAERFGVRAYHDLEHVGQGSALRFRTLLPEVSDLWGHLQRSGFCLGRHCLTWKRAASSVVRLDIRKIYTRNQTRPFRQSDRTSLNPYTS